MGKNLKKNWSNNIGFQENTKNKHVKWEIEDATRDPKYRITELQLLRVYLQKFNVHIEKT